MTSRVRKARHTSLLSCGHLVRTGQPIVSRNYAPWTCLPCALASIRGESRADPPTGAPPACHPLPGFVAVNDGPALAELARFVRFSNHSRGAEAWVPLPPLSWT